MSRELPHDPQPLDLDAIDALADAATPGPWGVYEYGGDSLIEIAAGLEDTGTGYSARRTVCRLDEEPLDNDPAHREWTAEEDWAQVQADARFIAAMSPDTVRAMADEIRRLRAELADVRAYEQRLREQHDLDVAELNRLRARVAELDAGCGAWAAAETGQ